MGATPTLKGAVGSDPSAGELRKAKDGRLVSGNPHREGGSRLLGLKNGHMPPASSHLPPSLLHLDGLGLGRSLPRGAGGEKGPRSCFSF